ncbi:pentapeptide repeat-containing protein [Actinocorallia sp. B10E7]|uniref:pentapeptide repeat-containing protein n=1 Tax=Actinocorallia sp. B10E7 TaxID=3153558 RepID=UPI00325ED5BE
MSDAPGSPAPADEHAAPALEPQPAPAADPAAAVPRVTAPTRAELDALPADRRLELMDLERQEADRRDQRRHRRLHTWILGAGVAATVGTLLVTALTLRSGQDQLTLTREGQVTDRYTKAVEQLGSDKREVRTAAVYALERIAKDSEPDRQSIRDLLAAFIRERDPAATVKTKDLPDEPTTDIAAALTVLARRPPDPATAPALDLHAARIPHTTLPSAYLIGANLRDAYLRSAFLDGADLHSADLSNADLSGAYLSDTDLHGANLDGANLRDAYLDGADLRDADLSDTDLRGAFLDGADLDGTDLSDTDLSDAYLSNTDLRGAFLSDTALSNTDLRGADLRNMDLSNTDLSGADLSGAALSGAALSNTDLRGADLRGTGLSEQEVRAMTDKVDGARFGPVE